MRLGFLMVGRRKAYPILPGFNKRFRVNRVGSTYDDFICGLSVTRLV